MLKYFIQLEWKQFLRSANFTKSIAIKIFLAFFALYFMAIFTFLGGSLYFLAPKLIPNQDPVITVCSYLALWFLGDLALRFFMQKLPVLHSKSFMVIPIKKKTIIHYLLAKSSFSIFNILPLFIFIPFSIVLLFNGYEVINVLFWLLSMLLLTQLNNFINFIINKNNLFFYAIVSLLVIGVVIHYFNIYNVLQPIGNMYYTLYKHPLLVLVPMFLLGVFYVLNYRCLLQHFYLDDGLSKKGKEVTSTDLVWLDKFGETAPFLKNDIKLIWRNKRPRMTVFMALFFLLYGLIFLTNPTYTKGSQVMLLFVGIFMTGMFMINFGQFIPAWDSAYFNLLMSQNTSIKQYLKSKIMLLTVSVVVLTLLSTPYVYFGWNVLFLIIVGAVYNIGVNIPVILFLCAFNSKRIDLSKSAIMNYEGMGITQWLMILPIMAVPMLLFFLLEHFVSLNLALLVLLFLGVLGIVLQKLIFNKLVVLYKKRKYAMVIGFQQK